MRLISKINSLTYFFDMAVNLNAAIKEFNTFSV